MATAIKVGRPVVAIVDGFATVSCPVAGEGLPDLLWFRVPEEFSRYAALDRPDWIPVSLLMPAMLRGRDLELDVSISEKLHHSLVGDLQYILGEQDTRLNTVDIRTRGLLDREAFEAGTAVGTGFSGGIDSFCTVAENSGDEAHPAFRLSHLVVNNVGAMGSDDNASILFQRNCARARSYAQASGFGFVSVDSNLADFYMDDFTFQQTHTIRNIAAVLVMQRLFQRYFYASTFKYDEQFVGPAYDNAYADPLLLNLLSTEHLEFISSGSRYSRLDKVKRVAEFPASYPLLDVCTCSRVGASQDTGNDYVNCSTCFKCRRQLYTLELLGKLEEYSDSFDLSYYKSNRTEIVTGFYFGVYTKSLNPNDMDVITLAMDKGQISPRRVRLMSLAIKWMPVPFSWRLCKILVSGAAQGL